MFKIISAIERAKNGAGIKYVVNPVISIFRFKNEKKLRAAFVNMKINRDPLIIPLLVLEYKAEEWIITYRSEEGQKMLFDEILREAAKLETKYFSPEIDNLANDDIASIFFKVLVERDLAEEGEIEEAGAAATNKWLKKSADFLRTYRQYIEDDKRSELRMYENI